MIFIVVKFKPKPEYVESFPDRVADFTRDTRNEPGNMWFDWSRSLEDPSEYVLVEGFRDGDAGKEHVTSEHFKKFIADAPATAGGDASDHQPDDRRDRLVDDGRDEGRLTLWWSAGIELGTEISLNCANADNHYAKRRQIEISRNRLRRGRRFLGQGAFGAVSISGTKLDKVVDGRAADQFVWSGERLAPFSTEGGNYDGPHARGTRNL